MTKRKLRSCGKCGVHHGPPIGTRCKREKAEFEDLNEEMGGEKSASDVEDVTASGREAEIVAEGGAALGRRPEVPQALGDNQDMMDEWMSFSEFRRRRETGQRASTSAASVQAKSTATKPTSGEGGRGPGRERGQ